MTRILRRSFGFGALAMALGTLPAWGWQQTEIQVPDSVVAQLTAAKKVFVVVSANHLSVVAVDQSYYDDQIANIFIAAQARANLTAWKLYDVVPRDAADLVLELNLDRDRQIRLVVRDARTQNELWTFRQPLKDGSVYLSDVQKAVSAVLDNLRQSARHPAATLTALARSSPNGIPKVFISSMGDDEGAYTRWHGQAYNRFYAAMQSSGQYDLVTSPASADFVCEIYYVSPEIPRLTVDPGPEFRGPDTDHEPYVGVRIWDNRTRSASQEFAEYVKDAALSANLDRNFAEAIQILANRAGNLLGQPPVAQLLPDKVPDAPVPSQIGAAKKVFISRPPPSRATQVYEDAYTEMKSWGRYELVAAKGDADLVLEPSVHRALVRLTIRDPESNVVLWGLTVNVTGYGLNLAQKKTLHKAVLSLMDEFHWLDARAAAGSVAKNRP